MSQQLTTGFNWITLRDIGFIDVTIKKGTRLNEVKIDDYTKAIQLCIKNRRKQGDTCVALWCAGRQRTFVVGRDVRLHTEDTGLKIIRDHK